MDANWAWWPPRNVVKVISYAGHTYPLKPPFEPSCMRRCAFTVSITANYNRRKNQIRSPWAFGPPCLADPRSYVIFIHKNYKKRHALQKGFKISGRSTKDAAVQLRVSIDENGPRLMSTLADFLEMSVNKWVWPVFFHIQVNSTHFGSHSRSKWSGHTRMVHILI